MRIDDVRTLYRYNTWANTRILDTAAQLPADQWASAALGACHLRDTLEHIMIAESIWRLRWQRIDPDSISFPEEFPTLQSLREQWRSQDQQLHAFLATLSDDMINSPFTYQRRDGPIMHTFWHPLIHVVNHGTQHRSEAALVLSERGHSPGDLDFARFVREQSS